MSIPDAPYGRVNKTIRTYIIIFCYSFLTYYHFSCSHIWTSINNILIIDMADDAEKIKAGGGMGLALTTIFIAGQMAGGGVLMLPG